MGKHEPAEKSFWPWRKHDLACKARDDAERELEAARLERDETRKRLDAAIRERDEARTELAKFKPTLFCSFCGKSQHEVRKLISGPKALICDECVDLCVGIVNEDEGKGV